MPPALRPRNRPPAEGVRGRTLRLPGPPFRLPAVADRVAEGWWRLTPRARTIMLSCAALGVIVATLLRVAASPYGPPVRVLVATVDLAAGSVLDPGAFTATRWPSLLLPPATLATRDDVAGARLATDLGAGSVLTRRHLRDDGPLADLAADAAGLAVPTAMLRGVTPGARLDLVTVAGDGTGRTVARDVRVLTVDGDTVWLEVARDRAADVAAAALRGTLSGAVLAR